MGVQGTKVLKVIFLNNGATSRQIAEQTGFHFKTSQRYASVLQDRKLILKRIDRVKLAGLNPIIRRAFWYPNPKKIEKIKAIIAREG